MKQKTLGVMLQKGGVNINSGSEPINIQSMESLQATSNTIITKEGFTTEFIEAEGENRPLFISDFPVDDER